MCEFYLLNRDFFRFFRHTFFFNCELSQVIHIGTLERFSDDFHSARNCQHFCLFKKLKFFKLTGKICLFCMSLKKLEIDLIFGHKNQIELSNIENTNRILRHRKLSTNTFDICSISCVTVALLITFHVVNITSKFRYRI